MLFNVISTWLDLFQNSWNSKNDIHLVNYHFKTSVYQLSIQIHAMQEHRLAAIMFTYIFGYTALMGSNEDHAFEVLARNREINQRLIKKYNVDDYNPFEMIGCEILI